MNCITIGAETPSDAAAIHSVEAEAFGREEEAILVGALRELNQGFISFVATESERIVGHICFSRVRIEDCDGEFSALAPLAVLASRQRRGIGAKLVKAGLDECRRRNVDAVFVVGDPAYYSRFGFIPASERGVRCEFEVPEQAFRVFEVNARSVRPGMLRYAAPFHKL